MWKSVGEIPGIPEPRALGLFPAHASPCFLIVQQSHACQPCYAYAFLIDSRGATAVIAVRCSKKGDAAVLTKILPENERFWMNGSYIRKVYILDEPPFPRPVKHRLPSLSYQPIEEWFWFIGAICSVTIGVIFLIALWCHIWLG